MLLVDPRAGSCELVAPLTAAGLPVEQTVLDYGDLAFMGRGVGGAEVWIGVEHKRLSDLVQSLTTDRLTGHQLPGLVTTYDRAYLVIEGEWDTDGAGRVVAPGKWRGRWSPVKGCPPASVLEQRVLTLETRGGLRVRWTPSQRASVRYVTALYRFWTDRDLDKHRSHLAIHAPDLDPKLKEEVSDFRKGLNGLVPGIGLAMSRAIEQRVWNPKTHQGSMRKLLLLTETELAGIVVPDDKGKQRRVGPARAKRILDALR